MTLEKTIFFERVRNSFNDELKISAVDIKNGEIRPPEKITFTEGNKVDAFRLLIESNSQEQIVEMTKSGNAKKLFDEYADCLADAKRKQPKRHMETNKEIHQLGAK